MVWARCVGGWVVLAVDLRRRAIVAQMNFHSQNHTKTEDLPKLH
jgi:hypothetical protein